MATTMKAWQYGAATGGLEKNIKLIDIERPSATTLTKDQVIVEIISVSVNPADYMIPETPQLGKLMIGTPAVPSMDFSGRVFATQSNDTLKVGQLVFGRIDAPKKLGTLAQFSVASLAGCVPLPDGVDPDHGATIGTAGATAYQSIVPYIKSGQKVFINGGSGGTGTFGIQIAKAVGAHVTTSCSTPNISLCKECGADEVLDYKNMDLIETLKAQGQTFDLIVDNVGTDPKLYRLSDKFMTPGARFVQVGAKVNAKAVANLAGNMLLPSFLGGGKRPYSFLSTKNVPHDLTEIAKMMADGKVKAIIQSTYPFEDAPKAFEELRTGRTKGKIVVHVADATATLK